jgi:hypothetical protein
MSHHFDSAADRADGRINLCDLYAFPGAPATTAVILTVNPDAGRSSPTTFRPDALYEFALASDGGTSEDVALRITFTEPNDAGQQQLRVLRADGPDARHGALGTLLGEGRTGEVFSLAGNGLAWAGLWRGRGRGGLPGLPASASAGCERRHQPVDVVFVVVEMNG